MLGGGGLRTICCVGDRRIIYVGGLFELSSGGCGAGALGSWRCDRPGRARDLLGPAGLEGPLFRRSVHHAAGRIRAALSSRQRLHAPDGGERAGGVCGVGRRACAAGDFESCPGGEGEGRVGARGRRGFDKSIGASGRGEGLRCDPGGDGNAPGYRRPRGRKRRPQTAAYRCGAEHVDSRARGRESEQLCGAGALPLGPVLETRERKAGGVPAGPRDQENLGRGGYFRSLT